PPPADQAVSAPDREREPRREDPARGAQRRLPPRAGHQAGARGRDPVPRGAERHLADRLHLAAPQGGPGGVREPEREPLVSRHERDLPSAGDARRREGAPVRHGLVRRGEGPGPPGGTGPALRPGRYFTTLGWGRATLWASRRPRPCGGGT